MKEFNLQDVLFTGIIAEKAKVRRNPWRIHLVHCEIDPTFGCYEGVGVRVPRLFAIHGVHDSANFTRVFHKIRNFPC
ncbi:unnamed protein product [Caenorhabditis auriculariae]|uniref:Uncharacterized protein n=1 Tax=Caenorhabditis auriculariae TaxID=2777116 RepID=A0A8S1HNB7_9PELO|nr:unnamed protein product [Caenorhabditis auriculariae]